MTRIPGGAKTQSIQAGSKSKRKPLTQQSAREYKLEKDIQKEITDWLDLTGLEYSVTDASLSVFKDESGKKHFRGAGKVEKSWPDLTVCLPVSFLPGEIIGAMLVIECKTPTGGYQPGQKEQLQLLNDSGAYQLTARSLDDVIAFLNDDRISRPFLRAIDALPQFRMNRVRELLSLSARA